MKPHFSSSRAGFMAEGDRLLKAEINKGSERRSTQERIQHVHIERLNRC